MLVFTSYAPIRSLQWDSAPQGQDTTSPSRHRMMQWWKIDLSLSREQKCPQSPRHHLGNFLPLQLRDGGEQAQVQLSPVPEEWSEGASQSWGKQVIQVEYPSSDMPGDSTVSDFRHFWIFEYLPYICWGALIWKSKMSPWAFPLSCQVSTPKVSNFGAFKLFSDFQIRDTQLVPLNHCTSHFQWNKNQP